MANNEAPLPSISETLRKHLGEGYNLINAATRIQLEEDLERRTRQPDVKLTTPVRFLGVDPLDPVRGAAPEMIPDSWRFGFSQLVDDGLSFGVHDNGPFVAWAAVKDYLPGGAAIRLQELSRSGSEVAAEAFVAANPRAALHFIHGLLEQLEEEKAKPALPKGWRVRRHDDGSIGIFSPDPVPGETLRTSHLIGDYENKPGHPARTDLGTIMYKFFSHVLDADPRAPEKRA